MKRQKKTLSGQRIAEWAESHAQLPAAETPAVLTAGRAPRHAPGRGSEMTDDEVNEVRLAFLCHHLNRVQLAEKFGRTRGTISRCLTGKEFEDLRRTFDLEVRDELRRRMIGKADDAVGHWERSMGNAAERGDHKPAKDWLLHAGMIDPVDVTETGPKVIVQIGVSADQVIIGVRADGSSSNITFADADAPRNALLPRP